MKNHEVKAILTTQDENGKLLKKIEPILVIGAISCSHAEYIVQTAKDEIGGFDTKIVSSKESDLTLFATPESDEIEEFYYKITVMYAVSGEGDKLKYERESNLILSKSALDAICTLASKDEIISVSKSRIVEVIEAPKLPDNE
jgi:hypothetical protein